MAGAKKGRGTDCTGPRSLRADAGQHQSAELILDHETELVQPLLISAKKAARVADIAESSWWKLCSAGRTPAPIRLGRSTRWSLDELRAWIAAGAPSRDHWQAMRERRP